MLRRAAWHLRAAVEAGDDVDALRRQVMAEVYRVLSIHLGTPPETFIWQWRDRDGLFTRGGEMTPRQFAAQYVLTDLAD